ncbi:MAG: hypothetical protein OXE80_02690 [Gammaproteobacteria bacterium]|nr:hypothetical protein [Gammaproteobacteria bacterium]
MDNLFSLTIDAGVFAVPHRTCSSADVEKYVQIILDCKKLVDESWVALYISSKASDRLWDDCLYPIRGNLKNLLNTHGMMEIDANTVGRVADHLLGRAFFLEDHYKISDVLWDNLEVEPDILTDSQSEGLRRDRARSVVITAILQNHCESLKENFVLILKNAPKNTVQLHADIEILEHERDDIPAITKGFSGKVLICDSFSGLIECFKEDSLLENATNKDDIEFAIKIALYKQLLLDNGFVTSWEQIRTPKIGNRFTKSCNYVCSHNSDDTPIKIMRSIIETCLDRNLSAVHALRKTRGGGSSQRVRSFDKARAQRRDIDRDLHLHYWQHPDGTIELASIVHHDDMSIPE